MTLPTIIPSHILTTGASELGDVIDEENTNAQSGVGGEDNSIPSWDLDSESNDDVSKDHIVSRFWGHDSSSSSDDNDNDNDNVEAKSSESQSAGCDANGEKGSLLKGIDDEDEERNRWSMDPDYAWDRIRSSQVFLEPPVKRILPLPRTKKEPPPPPPPPKTKKDKDDFVRFVFISDTHGKHRELPYLPRGDVLVHAGDFTKSGETGSIEDLGRYFREFLGGGGPTTTTQPPPPPPQNNTNPQRKSPPSGSYTAPTTTISGRVSFRTVICVAGNHDLTLDKDYYDRNWEKFHRKHRAFDPATAETAIRKDAVYLRDESYQLDFPFDAPTSADGNANKNTNASVHIWGSPYSPRFFDWAFNKERGAPIREIWDKIPSRESNGSNHTTTNGTDNSNSNNCWKPVDILITHGPPLGRGDLALVGHQQHPNTKTTRAGCYDLLEAIQHRVRPAINVFGHIHEGYGVTYDGTTLYVNASTMNERYEVVHLPIVVDLPVTRSGSKSSSETNSSSSSSSSTSPTYAARVVTPSSLFRNYNTSIASLEEWIVWCRHHGHYFVADALEKGLPAINNTTRKWFGDSSSSDHEHKHDEPPPDRFFETLAKILGYEKAYNRPSSEARRKLAAVVFHLYAESFDDTSRSSTTRTTTTSETQTQIQIERGPKNCLHRWLEKHL